MATRTMTSAVQSLRSRGEEKTDFMNTDFSWEARQGAAWARFVLFCVRGILPAAHPPGADPEPATRVRREGRERVKRPSGKLCNSFSICVL